MTNKSLITKIIVRNLLFIAGFYLLFFYQKEIATSELVGSILIIIAFNSWMINSQKKENGERLNYKIHMKHKCDKSSHF